ncbi:ribulose-phosphate 3-epimerase [Fomitopsis serialis]|uniref:ribulose-phosphate 3-epimerase n=1 Tax=Fomitopsis serialis TaxID=139415 RepID=UPI0020077505|nr:ribulose-phosphate 3-epimerase [Neoantrodia serialis]KAH9937186.1 ribulose-phosphate 3-epimerase [Neoantrodia serialis]
MPRAIISPSVLASDFGQLTAECKRMIKGGAEWLHMDVMDGLRCADPSRKPFVPNITMGAPILACVSKGVPGIFMDCHMMVAQPEKVLGHDIADAGGSLYCFHLEATSDPLSLISAIHERKMKAGVAISPDTASTAISDEVAEAADMLLVMTVYPGRGGQKFLERCVPKVAELRARFPQKDIEVDGGVGPKTIGVCADAGSNVIVAALPSLGRRKQKSHALLKQTVDTAQAKIAAM